MANLLDLSPDEFMFTLQEFGYAPERRDELIRQYREHNSVFGALNRAAQERQAEIAGEGRRPVAGGFLSKPEGSLGMDAVRGLRVEPMAGLLGMLTGAGRAVEAPAAAYQGLIPMADVPLEALGTAGMASLGGAAMTRPAGSVGMGGRVAGGESGAQTVARLLREGRQSEVTDDLLATLTPDDNAELFRLYSEGATGMDLPMDEASRMARARAAGFDPAFHGTGADIQAVDPSFFGSGADLLGSGFYTTSKTNRAERYVPRERTSGTEISQNYAEGGNILPLMVRGDRPFVLEEPLGSAAREISDVYGQDPFFNVNELSSGVRFVEDADGKRIMLDPMQQRHFALQNMRREFGPTDTSMVLADAGYSGVSGPEGLGGRVRVSYDPTDIRARTARFDPRLSDNANLLAANRDQTVGLLSTAAAAEPRNAAERMARDILDMRAAGRAGEVTDAMMAQADPQYMFANTPLPMDEASRMARADAGGFGGDLYHGSNADFAAFDPKLAEAGLQGRGAYAAQGPDDTLRFLDDEADGALIMPARMSGDTYSLDAASRIDPLTDEGRGLLSRFKLKPNRNYSGGNGGVGEQIYDLSRRRAGRSLPEYTPEWIAEIYRLENDRLKSAGYGNRIDEYTGYQMALDPSNIRSRFARFDPEFSHLSNLNAANVDPLAGLFGALAAEEQRRQRNSQ
jgi:hypothetical protein